MVGVVAHDNLYRPGLHACCGVNLIDFRRRKRGIIGFCRRQGERDMIEVRKVKAATDPKVGTKFSSNSKRVIVNVEDEVRMWRMFT